MKEKRKQCGRCGELLPLTSFQEDGARRDGRAYFCNACALVRNTTARLDVTRVGIKYVRWSSANRAKRKARRAVQEALDRGDLIQRSCMYCGNPESQPHHEDYTKPLEIVWLCVRHHAQRHAEISAKKKQKNS